MMLHNTHKILNLELFEFVRLRFHNAICFLLNIFIPGGLGQMTVVIVWFNATANTASAAM